MRWIAVVWLALLLVACGSGNPELQAPTTSAITTTPQSNSTPATSSAPAGQTPPTTTATTTTTTTAQAAGNGPGDEKIGVTDRVTIVIHDTEDGP